jgi:predicted transcriptional regulator
MESFAMNAPAFPLKLSAKDRKRLEAASKSHRKPKDKLVELAVRRFLDAEDEYQAAIQKGLDDVRAGRTIPHERVVAEMRQLFAEARAKRRPSAENSVSAVSRRK